MFHFSVVTPEKVFYEAEIISLIVPGTLGYLGVLSNHAPLITMLKAGKIEIRDAEDKHRVMAVSGGFLEVSNNKATLLAEAVEFAEDIDVERARRAYKLACDRLKSAEAGDKEVDIKLEEAAKARAANRVNIYRETH